MKRLSVKQLKLIRNILVIVTVAIGFVLWLYLPKEIKNSTFFHVGNGEYGSKYGALILLTIPLVAFIPEKRNEEIHTEDPEERAELEAQWKRHDLSRQVYTAIFMALVVWVCMGFGVLFQ